MLHDIHIELQTSLKLNGKSFKLSGCQARVHKHAGIIIVGYGYKLRSMLPCNSHIAGCSTYVGRFEPKLHFLITATVCLRCVAVTASQLIAPGKDFL